MAKKKLSKDQKPTAEPAAAPQGQESAPAPAANGPRLGQSRAIGTPAEHLIPHQRQPGSNGDVHRGPDRQLRINAVRGLILQALAAPQARLVKVEGKKRRVTVEVPMAMCDDIVAGLQLVARLGAQGRCLPEFLRMTFGLNQAMQPGPHEKNGNGHGGPRPATFVMAQPEPPAEAPGQAPAKPTEPGTLIGLDGKEYVSA